MSGQLLDVSTLPHERVYTCKSGVEIDLRRHLSLYHPIVEILTRQGLIKVNDSFGIVIGEPIFWDDEAGLALPAWDDPKAIAWFVGGWGPNQDRYIANALRKLRALVRLATENAWAVDGDFTTPSTLEMRFTYADNFQDQVDSRNEDGTFSWGDFPWGCAVIVRMGLLCIPVAISCLSEIEDDMVAKLIGESFGKLIVENDKLLTD